MSKDLLRSTVKNLKEYKPGKNPEKSGVIKLSSNENPFGSSPEVITAIKKELKKLYIYPDQKATLLRQAIADNLFISEDNLIIGNGSDDIMQIAAATFLSPCEEVIINKNSFSIYELTTHIFEGKIAWADLKDCEIDLDAVLKAVTPKTKIIFLTNPNNPTGTIFKKDDFEQFITAINENILVIVDEAYCEFVESKEFPDTLKYIRDGQKNLLILRTFSKFHGLAGLRVGYGIAHPYLINAMLKVKMPFNVNRLAQAGAIAALKDYSFLSKTYKNNLNSKYLIYKHLDKLGLSYKKTEANFIFIDLKQSSDEIFLKLMSFGVIIRPLASFGFPEAIRISIGTPSQNKKLISALKKVLGK